MLTSLEKEKTDISRQNKFDEFDLGDYALNIQDDELEAAYQAKLDEYYDYENYQSNVLGSASEKLVQNSNAHAHDRLRNL